MLVSHLNGNVDAASRRTSFIDDSVSWLTNRFDLSGNSKIVDFGCGPGLYTSRFAKLGAEVIGVDFSSRSIAYARAQAVKENLPVTYIEADYLEDQPNGSFDLVTMIMWDFCALGPAQRSAMLAKFRAILSTEGRLVFDVLSLKAFESKQEVSTFRKSPEGGFWSADSYFKFVTSFKYDNEKVGLDKYTIVERNRQRVIYNWIQYFSLESLQNELHAADLDIEEVQGDITGLAYDADHTEFAVVVKKR